ncbi:forkhead box protein R1 isoform X2 [Dendrobates tinctorius]|uniref:forkhead box protein R1 isoform X2 n=1 Tax=Dendrobates tinctorius TaxID=92724 RepID=UPI003CC9821A
MYLHFSDRARYENLHLSTGLEDWDMVEEMQQCVTTDQYSEESTFHPSLWLIVDPNVVMQCSELSSPCPEPPVTTSYRARSHVHCSTIEDSDDEALTSSSELCTEDDFFMSSSPSTHIQRLKYGKGQLQKLPHEAWPRPPINYCNLISLALKNSEDGSLNVQQIYSFVRPGPSMQKVLEGPIGFCGGLRDHGRDFNMVLDRAMDSSSGRSAVSPLQMERLRRALTDSREHFPFFRVAPDTWKNTVRHNLCFSSSFEKSTGWVCADAPRRFCLWKLTRQGRMKFRTDMHALSEELLLVLRKSMKKPALMELMFGM